MTPAITPSVMPALALPSEFGAAGYGSWLGYVIVTLALVCVSLNINEFAKREAAPGSLYVVAAKGLGPIWGVISGWSLLIGCRRPLHRRRPAFVPTQISSNQAPA